MKKILLLLAGSISMLASTIVNAQPYMVAPNSWFSNQLAANFPQSYTLGSWVASYVDSGAFDFDNVEIIIAVTKDGIDVADYSHLDNIQVNISYNTPTGSQTQTFFPTLVPGPGVTKKVTVSLPYIAPIDQQMSITLVGNLKRGADTAYTFMVGSCAVTGFMGTITSGHTGGFSTYIKKVVTVAPIPLLESVFTTLPAFEKVVGSFAVTFNDTIAWDGQINLEPSGDIMGYIPMLDNVMVVDSIGNVLTYPSSGSYGGIIGLGMKPGLRGNKGSTMKMYVLSNIISAEPGDFIQVAVTGICGQLQSFPAISSGPVDFCDFAASELGGRLTYSPVTAVRDIHAAGDAAVYPNPAVGNFTITCEGQWTATLTDMTGKTLHNLSGIGAKDFERGGLVAGVYFLTVKTSKGVQTFKIVFQ